MSAWAEDFINLCHELGMSDDTIREWMVRRLPLANTPARQLPAPKLEPINNVELRQSLEDEE